MGEDQGGICRGGSRGTFPSLDLTFPPTGLSENLWEMERGRRGKAKGKGKGGEITCLTSPPLASASNTTLEKTEGGRGRGRGWERTAEEEGMGGKSYQASSPKFASGNTHTKFEVSTTSVLDLRAVVRSVDGRTALFRNMALDGGAAY